MKAANYGYSRQIDLGFDEAIDKTKAELKKQGFGVLTEVNIQSTLKSKLDVDIEKYSILGACNPPAAYQALKAEPEIGLMLPCNVIVYQKDGKTFASAILPTVAMAMIDNDALTQIAQKIEKSLITAIDGI